MVMPSTVKGWMWWVSLVATILLIVSFTAGAFGLRKSGCLGPFVKSMWIPAVLFAALQLITLLVTKFVAEDPVVVVEAPVVEAPVVVEAPQEDPESSGAE
jgi:hypothetical protein